MQIPDRYCIFELAVFPRKSTKREEKTVMNARFTGKKHKERFYYYGIYTAVFAVISFLVFFLFLKDGRSFIYDAGGEDGISQHYISLVYLGNYLRDIISTLLTEHRLVIPQWDTTLGLGADVITTMNYYVLGDPLNLLAVFVSPEKTEYLYAFLVVLRIYLAGVAFSVYCRYWKFKPFYVLLGSYIYCFCNYALYTGIMHPFFLNPMIYLPLLLLGIDKIFDKKSPVLFAGSVFLSAVSNFYFFYMLSVFMFIYAVFRYFMIFGRIHIKELFGWLGKFIAFYILGTGLAGFLFLPNAAAILSSSRIGVEHYVPLLYPLSYYQRFLSAFVFNNCGYYTLLGFSSVAFLSMVILFMKKGNLHLKLGTGFLTAFLLIPYMGHVLNGFTYVSNRWSWSFSFLVALISVKMLPELALLTRREKVKVCMALLVYTLVALLPAAARDKGRIAAILLIWVCLVVLFVTLRLRPHLRKMGTAVYMLVLMGCTVAGMLLNAYARFASFGANVVADCAEAGNVLAYVEQDAIHLLADSDANNKETRIDTSDLRYRTDIRNAACIQNVNSTNFYFSTANTSVAEYMREMYLNTPYEQSYLNLDGRFVLNALVGCGYTAVYRDKEQYLPYGYEKKVAEDDSYTMYQSDISLPFSYVYDSFMDQKTYDALTVTQKQQAALQACAVDAENLSGLKNVSDTVRYTDQIMPYEMEVPDTIQVQDGTFTVKEAGSSIKLRFDGMDDSETYVIVEGMEYQALPGDDEEERISVNLQLSYENNRKNIHYITNKNNFYCGVDNFLCNMGYHEKGEKELTVSFPFAGIYQISDLRIVCQPVSEFASMTSERKQNGLSEVLFKGNTMTGTITTEKPQMLCVTIPYGEGWSAYVDGNETELYQLNTVYSGIYLTPGEHVVKMEYHTPYFRTGAVVSLASLVILVGIVQRYHAKRKKVF